MVVAVCRPIPAVVMSVIAVVGNRDVLLDANFQRGDGIELPCCHSLSFFWAASPHLPQSISAVELGDFQRRRLTSKKGPHRISFRRFGRVSSSGRACWHLREQSGATKKLRGGADRYIEYQLYINFRPDMVV